MISAITITDLEMSASHYRNGRHIAQLVKGDVGMVVQGNVSPNTLVLNVGGQPRTLAELPEEELVERRGHVHAAIAHRRRLTYLPRLVIGVLAGVTWGVVPRVSPAHDALGERVAFLCSVATALLSLVTAWFAVAWLLGAWARRQRMVRAELESVLAKIEAELDMRRPVSDFSRRALLNALLDRHRRLMPKGGKREAA